MKTQVVTFGGQQRWPLSVSQ